MINVNENDLKPIAKIHIKAMQKVDDTGQLNQAILAFVLPEVEFFREETKQKLEELSQEVAQKFSDILDFDNEGVSNEIFKN